VAGAVAALDLVPSTSRSFPESRRLRAAALYGSGRGLPALAQAMDSLKGVSLDPRTQAQLTADILERAVAEVARSGPDAKVTIGPYPAREESLRDGLETTYRALAATESDAELRYALVDKANAVRRWTLQ
jgi:serine/threonine-protein kinase PknG